RLVVGVYRSRLAGRGVDRADRDDQFCRARPEYPGRAAVPEGGHEAAAQLLRHASGPLRDRRLCRRRHHGEQLPGRERHQNGPWRQRRCRRLPLHLQRREDGPGTELRGGAGRLRSGDQRQVPAQDEPREAQLPFLADADDRSRDRCRLPARRLCLARRTDRPRAAGRRVGGARLLQALCRLDLGRLHHDGPRRPARHPRPALPRQIPRRFGSQYPGWNPTSMNRYFWILGGFAALVVLLAVGLGLNPRDVPSPLVGKPAPVFNLNVLAEPDRTLGPKDMQGKVWLLNVWSSWCVSCRAEHPVLVDFSRKSEVPLIGLNYKEVRGDGEFDISKMPPEDEKKLAFQ